MPCLEINSVYYLCFIFILCISIVSLFISFLFFNMEGSTDPLLSSSGGKPVRINEPVTAKTKAKKWIRMLEFLLFMLHLVLLVLSYLEYRFVIFLYPSVWVILTSFVVVFDILIVSIVRGQFERANHSLEKKFNTAYVEEISEAFGEGPLRRALASMVFDVLSLADAGYLWYHLYVHSSSSKFVNALDGGLSMNRIQTPIEQHISQNMLFIVFSSGLYLRTYFNHVYMLRATDKFKRERHLS